MKKILFILLMVLIAPSVYSQVIKYKGIEVDGTFSEIKTKLENKGIKYSTFDRGYHIFYTDKTLVLVSVDFHTHKVSHICEVFKFDSFKESKNKFTRIYTALSRSNKYECIQDYSELNEDGDASVVTISNISKINMSLGSTYQYMYGFKNKNMALRVDLLMMGEYYAVWVQYYNFDNQVIMEEEEF